MVSAVHTVKRSMFGGYRNVRLATTLLKDEESARDNDVLVCRLTMSNIHRLNKFSLTDLEINLPYFDY